MQLTGRYQLDLSAEELSTILDSLAVQPYNKVAPVIANLVAQVNARKPEEKVAD